MGKQTFSTAGIDTFDVPVGITSITVKAWSAGGGGAGGGTSSVGGAGGGGGYVQGDITVTPEETLNIHVGGLGDSGFYGGSASGNGGGGAGCSSIFRSSTPLFIAGGGGGGGGGDNSDPAAGGAGGAGGDSTGGSGGSSSNANGGVGGTQTTGGAGGTGGGTSGIVGEDFDGSPAGGGGAGANGGESAGSGGAINGGITNGGDGGDEVTTGFAGGGGGGSGRAGGGGGSCSASGDAGGGGGGGASNYIVGTATLITDTQASGQNPPNTGDPDYTGPVGVGGDGGATSSNGFDGNDGLIAILWEDPPVYGGMLFASASTQYLASVSSFTPPAETTVCFWMYIAATTGNIQRIMGNDDLWEIGLTDADPAVLFNDLNQTFPSFPSSVTFATNTRYHITCTAANTDLAQIYVNGVFDSDDNTASGSPGADTLHIGHRTGAPGDEYFNGFIEDMRIYDRVLSANEIFTIYSCRGLDAIVHGLLHRWLMNEKAMDVIASGAGSIKDVASGQLNMTPNNSPVYEGSQLIFKRKYRTH